jgi:hypothetical protein
MTYVELKNKAFYTETPINIIDNNLQHVGFITVQNKETGKLIIITSDNLLFADEC